jgi:TatD DNase family protein
MLIDSHVNLSAPQFAADRGAVIERARAAGVGLMVTICDRVSHEPAVRAISEAHADIWHTVGTHPHEAKEDPELAVEKLVALAAHPRCVGIGETGLDFWYDLSPRDVQARVFRAHIAAARQSGLPLVVHARDADDEMAGILEAEHAAGPFKLIMHCYTSGPDLLARTTALGAWFSVSGIATFKNAEDVRERVRAMPAERILVETDCPYLAPIPHRGRRNEPAYIGLVLAKLAEIRGWSLSEAETRTQDAFFDVFHRIPRPS